MTVLAVIAVIAVVSVAVTFAVTAGRRRGRERRDVENMFSDDPDDRVWWEERR